MFPGRKVGGGGGEGHRGRAEKEEAKNGKSKSKGKEEAKKGWTPEARFLVREEASTEEGAPLTSKFDPLSRTKLHAWTGRRKRGGLPSSS